MQTVLRSCTGASSAKNATECVTAFTVSYYKWFIRIEHVVFGNSVITRGEPRKEVLAVCIRQRGGFSSVERPALVLIQIHRPVGQSVLALIA